MIRNNKGKLIISSIIILLPMIAGIIFWNKLPQLMPVHWGIDGNVDSLGSRGFVVFGLPLIMLALHLVCLLFTSRDPGNKEQNNKALSILYWITPAITLMISGVMYMVASGREVAASSWLCALLGVSFLVLGNYMPKYRRNSTMGIKIKWTLESDENWNATHRFAGKIWVACGLVFLACIPLPEKAFIGLALGTIIVMITVPTIYSWRYHKKQLAEGFSPEKPTVELKKGMKIISTLIGIAILIGCIVILFTGNIEVEFGEESFEVKATYYSDLTVNYDAITSVEYRESFDIGTRISGFGTPRLSIGIFKNDEFGNYTIYAYNSTDPCVVITVNEKKLAINGSDEEITKQIYETLIQQ